MNFSKVDKIGFLIVRSFTFGLSGKTDAAWDMFGIGAPYDGESNEFCAWQFLKELLLAVNMWHRCPRKLGKTDAWFDIVRSAC